MGQAGRGLGHDDQLEGTPAHQLDDVQQAGQVAAALAERGPQTDHGRNAVIAADYASQAEHHVADERPDQDGEDRFPEAQPGYEGRTSQQHQETYAEIRPEDKVVQEAEHAIPIRDWLDADRRRGQVAAGDPQGLSFRCHRSSCPDSPPGDPILSRTPRSRAGQPQRRGPRGSVRRARRGGRRPRDRSPSGDPHCRAQPPRPADDPAAP